MSPEHDSPPQPQSEPQPAASRAAAPSDRQRPTRELNDAMAMRALAHPVRLALLEAIRREGELTATRAAALLSDSPGNMSWHLQTLAKYGFVEEAGGGKGRARPWRLVNARTRFDATVADPEVAAAGEVLEVAVVERAHEQLRQWRSVRRSYPRDWLQAAYIMNSVTYLTAAEMAAVAEEVDAIYSRYSERDQNSNRPAGSQPVHLYAHGHPLPPVSGGD